MASKSVAAETVRRLAMTYQGLIEAADLLESSEVADSYLIGVKTETDQVKAALENAKRALADIHVEFDKVQAAGIQELRDTDVTATKILADAKTRAAAIIREAQDTALVAVESERRVKETELGKLQDSTQKALNRLAELQQNIFDAQTAEREAKDKAAAATEALAAIQSQAQKIKQKMSAITGD